mgnify:FL=1
MSKIRCGDIVRLNSGGPCMLVELIRDDGSLLCMWESEGWAARDWFKPYMVTRTEDNA